MAFLAGQYLAGRPINVQYALKKDSKNERHGSEAERLLAAQRRTQLGAPPPMVSRPLGSLPTMGGGASGAHPPPPLYGGAPQMQFGQMAMPPPPPMPHAMQPMVM